MQDITLKIVITELPVEPVGIDRYDMTPTAGLEKFTANWEKIASRRSVNRTVVEVHALSYLSSASLSAEDVTQPPYLPHSTVSASLGVLKERGLTSGHHVRGDHNHYHESNKSPWEVFQLFLDDHKWVMIDPTLAAFKAFLDEQARIAPEDSYTPDHMLKVVSYFKAIYPLHNELRRLPNDPIQNLNKMTERVGEEIG